MHRFHLVREYLLSRLGADNPGSGLTIVESERRSKREMSYGFIHKLWIVQFDDGAVVASVPLNTTEKVKALIYTNKRDITDERFTKSLKKTMFGKESCRCFCDLVLACDASTLALPGHVIAKRIVDTSYGCAGDIHFPAHCLPDGIVYGVIEDDTIVSIAYAHQTGEYQDIVADIGVETSKKFRQKGYARACVHAVAQYAMNSGGESVYKCKPDNKASIQTALSAGYVPYGKSLIFSVQD